MFDFPVELQPVFTKSGETLPKSKAIVRLDTGEALSVVSNRYRLVTHAEVLKSAERFIESFGTPSVCHHLSANGARLAAEYTYKEKVEHLDVGDSVGLRVYVENSYNSTCAVKVYIGMLVLSCKNGMMVSKERFSFSTRHVHGLDLTFPDKALVLQSFGNEVDRLNQMRNEPVPSNLDDLAEKSIVSQDCINYALAQPSTSMWDFVQHLTHHTTHQTPNLGPFGRLAKLERIQKWSESYIS